MQMEIAMSVNGEMTRIMAKVFIFTMGMELYFKATGTKTHSQAKEKSLGLMVPSLKENT